MPEAKDSLADLRRDIVTVAYEAAGTATPAPHHLGRTPNGYVVVQFMPTTEPTGGMVMDGTAHMTIYQMPDDISSTTDKVIYTRSTAVGTAKLEVI